MILHILDVMYQKMKEQVRMWKPESRRPEERLLSLLFSIVKIGLQQFSWPTWDIR
jgi:hypothetical protein